MRGWWLGAFALGGQREKCLAKAFDEALEFVDPPPLARDDIVQFGDDALLIRDMGFECFKALIDDGERRAHVGSDK